MKQTEKTSDTKCLIIMYLFVFLNKYRFHLQRENLSDSAIAKYLFSASREGRIPWRQHFNNKWLRGLIK
jgi:hypothetical protein